MSTSWKAQLPGAPTQAIINLSGVWTNLDRFNPRKSKGCAVRKGCCKSSRPSADQQRWSSLIDMISEQPVMKGEEIEIKELSKEKGEETEAEAPESNEAGERTNQHPQVLQNSTPKEGVLETFVAWWPHEAKSPTAAWRALLGCCTAIVVRKSWVLKSLHLRKSRIFWRVWDGVSHGYATGIDHQRSIGDDELWNPATNFLRKG